ncbi:MAG: PilC/PilY family type IV pilus protein [Woeseiaceae bacterium]|nr:PilC/PilY family type IV pilus protein [Woeseiaceae bacterium]
MASNILRKTTGLVSGLALALAGGSPALADDTELLLQATPNADQLKPNVMFILDTSGSMTTTQSTNEEYDPNGDYSAFGNCDMNTMYLSEDGSAPECSTTTLHIDKDSWHCQDAAVGHASVGSYTGVLAQHRSGTSGNKEWQPVEAGNSSDDVECEADAGSHGSKDDDASFDVYPAAGAGSGGWTSDPNAALNWGSSGASRTYAVFDGNYLNYRSAPATVTRSRSQIMISATKNVLNSVKDMNVGLMRFNDSQGGVVIRDLSDLDTNRAAIMADIDSLDADGWTPLSETLFEAALFWQGLPAHYGELYEQHATDPEALVAPPPATEVYERPELYSCSKNFNVLITDGQPTEDVDTPGLLGQLPDYSATLDGRTGCTGSGDGACLDDVAEYLSKVDIHPTLDGRQSVITHTIGYDIDLQSLEDTADVSGGKYLLADDSDTLVAALTEVIAHVNERSLSFSAPAVSVNTFNRTRNLNDVYLTMFGARGNVHWPGNLKAYRIKDGEIVDALDQPAVDPSTGFFFPTARSFWTDGQADGNDVRRGGAANMLPDPDDRNLFTDNGSDSSLSAGSNALTTSNARAYSAADFGLTGPSPTVSEMIDWMRGTDVKDVDRDPSTTTRYAMGDPLHSRPAAVVYGGTDQNPEAVIYAATNDGYLHAIDASNGRELWSYVPKELLPRMASLYEDPEVVYKQYGLDGDVVPVIRDVDGDGTIEATDGDFVYILFGMRRGGSTYRMLDVTNRTDPVLVWERTLDDGGQSWSAPVVTRIDIQGANQNALKAVVVLGGGYDGVHDTASHPVNRDGVGAGVHVLDLVSGTTLWRAAHDSDAIANLKLKKMTRSIPTRIRVIDINGDGFADRMYAADLGGQLWRFDVMNGNPANSLVAGGVIAQLGAEGLTTPTAAETRRFYNTPDIAMFNDSRQNRRYISVSIGSGYRAHPLDLSATDRFYSIRDPNVFNALDQDAYNSMSAITESDLIEVSGQVGVTVTEKDAGWMLTLPANQMVLADAATFNNEIFFVSFSPDSAGSSACRAGQGANFLWRVSVLNGDPIVDDLGNIRTGGEDLARRTRLAQGGIAPSPQFLFPTEDDPNCTGTNCAPPPIGCIGVECFDPGFANFPVRTLWTQDGIE